MILGLIGTIASVIGAVISIIQGKKALNAKQAAEKIRDSLNKKYLNYELSHLRPRINEIVNKLTNYTSKSKNSSKFGLNYGNDLNDLKRLINDIRSNKIYSIEDVKQNIDDITQIINNENNQTKINEIIIFLTNISRTFDNYIKKED